MNSKWYLSILVIALAFFGKSFEPKNVPNQEIIVQFGDHMVSPTKTQDALENLQKQLQAIGAEQIQVTSIEGNTLKVTYFSTIDVAIVKALFSKEEGVLLEDIALNTGDKNGDSSSVPFTTDSSTYQLNVSEIPTNSESSLGFNGVLVEVKFTREHLVHSNVYFRTSENNFSLKKTIEEITNSLHLSEEIITDNASYKIPEVRAGPLS